MVAGLGSATAWEFGGGAALKAAAEDAGASELAEFLAYLDAGLPAVTLSVLTLVLVSVGPSIYVYRTLMLDVAMQDHVTVARAKGLPEGRIRRRHILRVAAPPIVTGLILGLAASLGGAILIETVFSWEGMGQLYFKTISGEPDETVSIGLTIMLTQLYVGERLLLEILYVFLDPRVRYE